MNGLANFRRCGVIPARSEFSITLGDEQRRAGLSSLLFITRFARYAHTLCSWYLCCSLCVSVCRSLVACSARSPSPAHPRTPLQRSVAHRIASWPPFNASCHLS